MTGIVRSPMAELPLISIVTPCLNQERFLERTILSVQGQRYPHIEHVLIDGGSTDGTMSIARRHERHFATIVSERDHGMYDAINKGFSRTTGSVMAWINADDEWLPGTLLAVGRIFAELPEVEWISTSLPAAIDEDGAMIKVNRIEGFSKRGFLSGENFAAAGWTSSGYIQQESTFWRRSLWARAGSRLDDTLKSAGDFELWSRFFGHAELFAVDVPFGCYRRHASQKTSSAFGQYLEEARAVFAKAGGKPPREWQAKLRIFVRTAAPRRVLRWLSSTRLMDGRPWVTYDWGRQTWTIERR